MSKSFFSFSIAFLHQEKKSGTGSFEFSWDLYSFLLNIHCSISLDSSSTKTSSRSEEHTSELQSRPHLVCRLLLEKKKKKINQKYPNNHYYQPITYITELQYQSQPIH